MHNSNHSETINAILKRDVRSISRLLTQIEHRNPAANPLLKALYAHTGKANVIGITGAGGVGKSTLINQLVTGFRAQRQAVAVLAIDPSSPFSGGAMLGDRIRMHQHFLDRDVYIRSLSTQGMGGGLSPALFQAIHVLDAAGYDIIIIETIGVGQDEVQIAGLSPTVLLVLAPGTGDEIQTMKAGLFEIGDVLVVNKGDLEESDAFLIQLQVQESERPVIKVSSDDGNGIFELLTILKAQMKAVQVNQKKKAALVTEELHLLLCESIKHQIGNTPFSDLEIEAVLTRKKDPNTVVADLLKKKDIKPFS